VRQRRNAHPRGNHLNQQQRIINTFQRRAHARRLQEVTPDIQAAALYGVNQQRFAGDIVRRDARFRRQRMIGGEHQTHFKIKHRRIVQTAARQNVGGHDQIQLALLQRRLRIKRDAGFEIHLHLRPVLAKVLKRRCQPLNTAMALNSDAQRGLLRLIAGLQRAANLRQHLIRQLQQNFTLRRKAQRLAFPHKQTKAKALFQIAELVGKRGLRLMQRCRRCRQRPAVS